VGLSLTLCAFVSVYVSHSQCVCLSQFVSLCISQCVFLSLSHDNYFVTGDIVSVEAPVNLAVTLDGVPITVITPIPAVIDSNFKVETVVSGLSLPTTMAFLGPDDILVLQKNDGKVMRILSGILQAEPVLDVSV